MYRSRFSRLPKQIKKAFAAARFRPKPKECFSNAALLVMQNEVPLEYVEGWAQYGGVFFLHAWVRHHELGDVDPTLLEQNEITYEPVLVMDPRKACEAFFKSGHWGPWSPQLDGFPSVAFKCELVAESA